MTIPPPGGSLASDTMRTWHNQLYLGPLPGLERSIRTFENELRSAEIHTVVCLNPPAEIEHLSPEYARWREGVRARGGIDTGRRDRTVSPGESGRAPASRVPDGAAQASESPAPETSVYPLSLVDIPIVDYRAPSPEVASVFWRQARRVGELITAGKRVFVHCTAGRGRTGTFGVAVLISMGYTYADAAQELWTVGSYPEAAEQEAFLLMYT